VAPDYWRQGLDAGGCRDIAAPHYFVGTNRLKKLVSFQFGRCG
jgi:hypothetical protein